MGFKRFLTGLCLGLIVSLVMACSEQIFLAEPAGIPPQDTAVSVEPVAAREGSAPAAAPAKELPAETKAIVNSVAGGMANPPAGMCCSGHQ
jgi:hypothetical protein